MRTMYGIVTLTAAAGLVTGCDGGGGLGGILISDEEEVQLGAGVDEQIELQSRIATDTDPVTTWARDLVAPLAEASTPFRDPQRIGGYKVEVIVDDELVNAFAAPGGFTYITTGLILSAETCGEIAGVMGHELGHVTQRHGVEKLGEAFGAQLLAEIFLDEGIARDVALTAFSVLQNTQWSQDDESESDSVGLQIAHDAGYNPYGIAKFFTTLLASQGQVPELLEFFSSHPPTDERIDAVIAEIQERYPTVGQEDPVWDCIGTSQTLAEIQAHIAAGVAVRAGTGICAPDVDPLPAECQPPAEGDEGG